MEEKAALIPKNKFTYFEDIKFAFFKKQPVTKYNLDKIRGDVLGSNYL